LIEDLKGNEKESPTINGKRLSTFFLRYFLSKVRGKKIFAKGRKGRSLTEINEKFE